MSIAPQERHRNDQTDTAIENPPGSGTLQPSAAASRTPSALGGHLKLIPTDPGLRVRIRDAAEKFVERFDKSQPFTRSQLEHWTYEFLDEQQLPDQYCGFAAVMLGNGFWKQQLLSVPLHRRALLLPHCIRDSATCPAQYDKTGLHCEHCGACSISELKRQAEELGYRVLVAEGTPAVLNLIVDGTVDGILGVACLNVLEKSIDKILFVGVPSYAVPLHTDGCKDSTLDEYWVKQILAAYDDEVSSRTGSYVSMMRAASRLFNGEFEHHLPPRRKKSASQSPLAKTESIAVDWLIRGGKRFRPFITLAAYDALTGGTRLQADADDANMPSFPDAVSRVAMSIEAFHKASLVHDDIEDDDLYRYGRETLHRQYDLGTAINVGDYLIGVGYRLINSARDDLGAEVTCDILDRMATAHVQLCDGQGAEMAWQSETELALSPLDALKIYALKTAPAFEAALYAGIRMACPTDDHEELIAAFSRQLGVGFQILNDLKDWHGDNDNKLVVGQDTLALRPTLLLALLGEALTDAQRDHFHKMLATTESETVRLGRVRRLLEEYGVFNKAEALVDKCRQRAQELAESADPPPLRRLLQFLIDTVLAPEHNGHRSTPPLVALPIVQPDPA